MPDEATITRIIQLVRAGVPAATAGRAAGLSPNALAVLLTSSEGEAVHQAAAEFEARNVAIVSQAATEHWQAAAWLLERGVSERWARPSQRADVTPTHQPGSPSTASDPFAEADHLAVVRAPAP